MPYVYAALWLVIGFILILKYRKESPIFYAAGGFFFFLGFWWGADAILAVDLFASPWVWILRAVSICVLLPLVIFYFKHYRDRSAQSGGGEEKH